MSVTKIKLLSCNSLQRTYTNEKHVDLVLGLQGFPNTSITCTYIIRDQNGEASMNIVVRSEN
jgi:hypothetical protein